MLEETDKKKDDIVWQMSNDVIKEEASNNDWKNRRAVPLVQMKLLSQGNPKDSFFTMHDEGHTRTLASLVPDEIIYNIGDYSKREIDGCLLFGDVSGFTDLCEKYNKSGKGGPSRLTQVLNNYIGAMVQEILSHGGDVLKFSGDAFIALWKVKDTLSMRDSVHEAIDCSLVIQKTYGTYQTDVDVVCRVKLAVANGHLVFSLVGNEENSHYLMTGDPIYAIKAAEYQSSAGEIVITARVSRHISANEYLIDVLPDGLHAKVLGVGPNWRNVQRQTDKDRYGGFGRDLDDRGSNHSSLSFLSTLADHRATVSTNVTGKGSDDDTIAPIVTDQYALRPAVNHAARMRLKDDLKKFIIAPVVRGIDASEPLEYLTEIRQVAILFVNCKVSTMVGPVEGIDVADRVFITVCNAVKNNYGCVNKISNFDKDLMLLVIFGLRGFKHELESQIALKCATESFEKINSMEEIDEVAAAVTTGSCYCGAFGHTLRREYTVIGLVVNKAARLMVAYPNKVTCDRETFLYSKLEAANFILQEYKPLKGIVNPGPIYEFKAVERANDLGISTSPFPLLGREQELDLYMTLLEIAKSGAENKESAEKYCNMLIIRGDFRQGKTRILEEILYVSDRKIPIQSFALTPYDKEVSFRTIQYIFQQFIGFPKNSARTSRERRLHVRLEKDDVSRFYFVFNKVFDVRFRTTVQLESEEESLELLSNMFTLLCKACFTSFWIIAIDDADNIDDESWMLLQILIDLRLVFVVATVGTQKGLTSYAITVLKNENIKIIGLKPIDKWFHVGLICQMLGIDGVPPELEKIVQLKSNGNPGWIQSFLVTLMQSDGINVTELRRIEAYNMGVVMAPLYMLLRLSQEELELWIEIMEEKIFSRTENEASKRWKIFLDCCRDSYPDLTVAKMFEDFKSDAVINVVFINPEYHMDEVVPEQHMDVVILKTFDSLTSYEQLLLKCSSVLGDTFTRNMLLYIMSSTATRLTALAVQKLFEIQVLSCARGNFLEGGLNFKDRLVDPNEDLSVKCDCIGLTIDDTCIDMPKFASCGYMRFRSSEFRETTYNLLTDNQKREFHGKAIRYIEKETRRCRSCGSGYFTRYMGIGRLDIGLRMKSKSTKFSIASQDSTETPEKGSSVMGSTITSLMPSKRGSSFKARESDFRASTTSTAESLNIVTSDFFSTSGLGVRTIKKLKNNLNLVRTFSSFDYSQCTCLLILNTMYSSLIGHCKGAGLVEKIMEATIEYSYVCLENKNSPQAIKVLEEAMQLLEGPMKEQIELDWMVELKRGKLLTLLGRARMDLDNDEAYTYLLDALDSYGISFPKTNVGKNLMRRHFKLKQNLRLYLCSGSSSNKNVDEDLANYCNNVSECLHLLCLHFTKRNQWKEAEVAALWSLSKALQTETDFQVICLAYASMIFIAAVNGQLSLSVALEVFALRMCHQKKTIVEIDELQAVSMLYYHIGRVRLLRGEIDKALQMGYPIWRISNSARCSDLLFESFPMLALATVLKMQIVEFGNVLTELLYLIEQEVDHSELVWYHSLCLVFNLETGLLAESMDTCNAFIQAETFEDNLKNPSGKMRLIICKWLWELRNDNSEAATMWVDYAWDYKILEKGEHFNHIVTGLYVLEGMIIYMVNKMDMKNVKASIKIDFFVNSLFRKLIKAMKICPVLLPRLYHLKAYYIMAKKNNYATAYKYLRKAHKLAEKHHNELERNWVEHSEQAWSSKLPTDAMFAWQEHAEEDNVLKFNELEVDKFIPYTLPLPLYI